MASILDSAKQALGLSDAPAPAPLTDEQKAENMRKAEAGSINPPKPGQTKDDEGEQGGAEADFSSETAGISSTGNMTTVEVAQHGAPGRGSALGPNEGQGAGEAASEPDFSQETAGISATGNMTPVEVSIHGAAGRGSALGPSSS